MSKIEKQTLECPKCHKMQETLIYNSVNVTIDDSLKERVLGFDVNVLKCTSCGNNTQINTDLLYHDISNKFMVHLVFNEVCDPRKEKNRPMTTSMLKAGYILRVVDQYNHLIEKVTIFDAGLNDEVIELIKYKLCVGINEDCKAECQALFAGVNNGLLDFILLGGSRSLHGRKMEMPLSEYEAAKSFINEGTKNKRLGPESDWLFVDSAYVLKRYLLDGGQGHGKDLIEFEDVKFEIKSLIELLDDALVWGKKHNWPVMGRYPQYKEIRVQGSEFHLKGGLDLMQHSYHFINSKNQKHGPLLNHFWSGVGDWLS